VDSIVINGLRGQLEKEEILAEIRRGQLEGKESGRTGKRMMSAQELLNDSQLPKAGKVLLVMKIAFHDI